MTKEICTACGQRKQPCTDSEEAKKEAARDKLIVAAMEWYMKRNYQLLSTPLSEACKNYFSTYTTHFVEPSN